MDLLSAIARSTTYSAFVRLFSSHTHAQPGSRPALRPSAAPAYRVTSDGRSGASIADTDFLGAKLCSSPDINTNVCAEFDVPFMTGTPINMDTAGMDDRLNAVRAHTRTPADREGGTQDSM